jgi:hypothetical protein
MNGDDQPPFRPSPRFVAIHGVGVSPTHAERILTGVLPEVRAIREYPRSVA